MKETTRLVCLCWEPPLTPETTARLQAASSTDSVTQVKVQQDGCYFEKFGGNQHIGAQTSFPENCNEIKNWDVFICLKLCSN